MDDKELIWARYAMIVDLYKFTTDFYLKVIAIYFTLTGGLVSYYFAHVAATTALKPSSKCPSGYPW